MTLPALTLWFPFLVAFGALVVAQWLVTQVVIGFFFRITHNPALAMLTYALIVWPGTVLHELAHWVVARLLGVRARLPYLLPSGMDKQGRMVLGHVVVQRSDVIRRALIGVAPFVVGSATVALLAHRAFALPIPAINATGIGGLATLVAALPAIWQTPNAWLYLYLLFSFANGMMPSPSDREAWPVVLLFALLIAALIFLFVGVPQVPASVARGALRAAAWLTFAFSVTVLLNAALLLLVWPLERLLWLLGR
ncbi:MAG: hypothetical protein ACRDIB_09100 [Ardenticatenaceae bacterium]